MRYREMGFKSFRMKIGGASLALDMRRVEEALSAAGGGEHLMVDANGRFDLPTALAYAKELAPLGLRWFEEIGDPLDYQLNRKVIEAYGGDVAVPGQHLNSRSQHHSGHLGAKESWHRRLVLGRRTGSV